MSMFSSEKIQRHFKETLINSPRADAEKICVLTTALFRRNTLCILRKSNAFGAQKIRRMPKADRSALT